jgi:hypothetical protein
MNIQGDIARAQKLASAQPWVAAVRISPQGTSTKMIVTVTDESIAQTQLLRLLMADEQLVVTNFGRKVYKLEEIFMGIVEGVQNESK